MSFRIKLRGSNSRQNSKHLKKNKSRLLEDVSGLSQGVGQNNNETKKKMAGSVENLDRKFFTKLILFIYSCVRLLMTPFGRGNIRRPLDYTHETFPRGESVRKEEGYEVSGGRKGRRWGREKENPFQEGYNWIDIKKTRGSLERTWLKLLVLFVW